MFKIKTPTLIINELAFLCELGGSRTHNRLIRSQGLYPIELLVHCDLHCKNTTFFDCCAKKVNFFVGEGGLEPPNSSEDRFTVCCNCRYATPPMIFALQKYKYFCNSQHFFEKFLIFHNYL